MKNEDKQRIDKLLALGIQAKEALYFELLKKFDKREKMTIYEQRTFNSLHKELKEIADRESESDENNIALKFGAAAKYLGYSTRKLSHLVTIGNIRQEPNGDFLRNELDRYVESQGGRSNDRAFESKERADAKLKELKIRKELFLLEQLTEQNVPLKEVYRAWGARLKELSTAIMSLPNSLPPKLEGKDRHDMMVIIKENCQNILNTLARESRWTPLPDMMNQENMNSSTNSHQKND